jgi:hypothetical protein
MVTHNIIHKLFVVALSPHINVRNSVEGANYGGGSGISSIDGGGSW